MKRICVDNEDAIKHGFIPRLPPHESHSHLNLGDRVLWKIGEYSGEGTIIDTRWWEAVTSSPAELYLIEQPDPFPAKAVEYAASWGHRLYAPNQLEFILGRIKKVEAK